MKTTLDMVQDALYDSFREMLDWIGYDYVGVVFGHQNGMEPENTYLMINILDITNMGRVDKATYLTNDKDEQWYTNHYELFIRVSFIGKRSGGVSLDFNELISSSTIFTETLQKRGLGYLRKSSIRRIPQPRESEWIESWNVDYHISYATQSRHVMDWIEFITINGNRYRVYPEERGERTVDTGEYRTVDSGEVREISNDRK